MPRMFFNFKWSETEKEIWVKYGPKINNCHVSIR